MQVSDTLARGTVVLPHHHDHPLSAADRLFEVERNRLVEIDPSLRLAAAVPCRPLMKDIGEQVAEGRRVAAVDADCEVEPVEPERRGLPGRRPYAVGVVLLAQLDVAQRFLRFGNLAELSRGHAVARVDVRMEFPREPLVGALEIGLRRAAFDSEDDVEVHFLLPLPTSNF
jgi:hypothetical protein